MECQEDDAHLLIAGGDLAGVDLAGVKKKRGGLMVCARYIYIQHNTYVIHQSNHDVVDNHRDDLLVL